MANIPIFRGVADRTGCSAPSPVPSPSERGAAKAWRIFPSLEGWPTGRGVPWQHRESAKVLRGATPSMRGNLAPSPMLSHSGRGVAKAWRIFPSLEGWPTGRGVHFRPLGSVADYPVRHIACHPFEKGNLAPSPVPSHSGRGVAKAWRIFPSLEETPRRQDGECWTPSPMPCPSGRGVAKAWRIFPSKEECPTGRGVR